MGIDSIFQNEEFMEIMKKAAEVMDSKWAEFEEDETDEELDNTLELIDDEGNTVFFEMIDIVDYQEEEYVVLIPSEEKEEEEKSVDDFLVLKVENPDSDEPEFVPVEDEAIENAVMELFAKRFSESLKSFLEEEENN